MFQTAPTLEMPAKGLNAQTATELHSKRVETAFKRSNEPNTPTGLKRLKLLTGLETAQTPPTGSKRLQTAQTAIFRANKCRHTAIFRANSGRPAILAHHLLTSRFEF